MSNLMSHAKRELELLHKGDKDEWSELVDKAVLGLIALFSDQGHSGASAQVAIQLFEKLAHFEPLLPLTGDDSEWMEVGGGTFQNKRCGHVFKDNELGAYDIDGFIFREPDGQCYTNGASRRGVEFPYTPKRIYLDVDKGREVVGVSVFVGTSARDAMANGFEYRPIYKDQQA